MKNLTKYLGIGALVGSLAFGNLGNNVYAQDNDKRDSLILAFEESRKLMKIEYNKKLMEEHKELIEYTKENKQTYEYFKKFLKDIGGKCEYSFIKYERPFDYIASLDSTGTIRIIDESTSSSSPLLFVDRTPYGIKDFDDVWSGATLGIRELPPNFQLRLAKNYTEILKKMMEHEGDGNYPISEELKNEIKEFNEKNGKVYEDFKKFLEEKGGNTNYISKFNEWRRFKDYKVLLDTTDNIKIIEVSSRLMGGRLILIDKGGNGMKDFDDVWKGKKLDEFLLGHQFKLAKDYTNLLKKMMKHEGYGNYHVSEELKNEFREFNEENKQVYGDFKEFLEESGGVCKNPLNNKDDKFSIDSTGNIKRIITSHQPYMSKIHTVFVDKGANGMKDFDDVWAERKLGKFFLEDQLKSAEDYTNILKDVMKGVGYGNYAPEELKNEFREFNEENKQVYGDFKEFLKENKGKHKWKDGLHKYKASLDATENIIIRRNNTINIFVDKGGNGMKDFDDLWKGEMLGRILLGGHLGQLKIAKKYTENLKKALHKAEYKNY